MFSRSFALITFSTTLLALNTACEELEGEALPADDTAAYGYEDEDLLQAELDAELLDEEILGEEADEQAVVWAAPGTSCYTSGKVDTAWFGEYATTGEADLARGVVSWSGNSVGSSGSLSVNVTLENYSYGGNPITQTATGRITVNGVTCGTASNIDSDGGSSASKTTSCSVPWSGLSTPTVTVTMADSSKGTRWEFIRSTGNHQMYKAVSGSSSRSCW